MPIEVLARHGVNAEDVFARTAKAGLRDALAELRRHARVQLEAVAKLVPGAPSALIPALLPVSVAGLQLDRMENSDFDPFDPPEVPPMAAAMADVACCAKLLAYRLTAWNQNAKRSRKLRRSETMRLTSARSVSLRTSGAIRSTWFMATSCRISLRTSPSRVAWQGVDDLQMLGRRVAAEEFAQLAVARARLSTKA